MVIHYSPLHSRGQNRRKWAPAAACGIQIKHRGEPAEWYELLWKDMEFPTWEIFKNSLSIVKANLKIKSCPNSSGELDGVGEQHKHWREFLILKYDDYLENNTSYKVGY